MLELSVKKKGRKVSAVPPDVRAGIRARVAYTQGKLDESLGRYVREAAERGLPDAIGLELEWWNQRIAPRVPDHDLAESSP